LSGGFSWITNKALDPRYNGYGDEEVAILPEYDHPDASLFYPALLKLEQEGYIRSQWGSSENNRRAKFYELTKVGQRRLRKAAGEWKQTTEILARFLEKATEA